MFAFRYLSISVLGIFIMIPPCKPCTELGASLEFKVSPDMYLNFWGVIVLGNVLPITTGVHLITSLCYYLTLLDFIGASYYKFRLSPPIIDQFDNYDSGYD